MTHIDFYLSLGLTLFFQSLPQSKGFWILGQIKNKVSNLEQLEPVLCGKSFLSFLSVSCIKWGGTAVVFLEYKKIKIKIPIA